MEKISEKEYFVGTVFASLPFWQIGRARCHFGRSGFKPNMYNVQNKDKHYILDDIYGNYMVQN